MHAPAWQHTPVLLHEAIEAILGDSGGIYVDGTFGRGGHSRALLARLSPAGRLIAFDKDPQAVQAAAEGPERIDDPRFVIEHASFASMREHLAAREISSVHGVLLDLGCQFAADRRAVARLQFPLRCAIGHAHGHEPRRNRGAVSGPSR